MQGGGGPGPGSGGRGRAASARGRRGRAPGGGGTGSTCSPGRTRHSGPCAMPPLESVHRKKNTVVSALAHVRLAHGPHYRSLSKSISTI